MSLIMAMKKDPTSPIFHKKIIQTIQWYQIYLINLPNSKLYEHHVTSIYTRHLHAPDICRYHQKCNFQYWLYRTQSLNYFNRFLSRFQVMRKLRLATKKNQMNDVNLCCITKSMGQRLWSKSGNHLHAEFINMLCCLNASKNISRKVNFKIDFNVNPFHAIGLFLKLLKTQKTRGPTIFSGVHQTISGTK